MKREKNFVGILENFCSKTQLKKRGVGNTEAGLSFYIHRTIHGVYP